MGRTCYDCGDDIEAGRECLVTRREDSHDVTAYVHPECSAPVGVFRGP